MQGVWCDAAELDRLFRLRSERVFDRQGYLRFRRARLFATRHPSQQPLLPDLGEVEWHPAMPLRPYATRRPRGTPDAQRRLLP